LRILISQVPPLQQDWQGAVTDARSLAADNLLPLAEPVEPIEGWHDTAGPVKRVIWLETNDPAQPVVEVSFTANVRKG
jgi:hypothetical protein